MLSTSNLKSAQAASYFEKDDYYSHEDGPNHSRWVGKGAEQLDLAGGVDQETFQKVLTGKSAGGQPLFNRRIDPAKRRAATDFTFSAPKSVSVAALVQGDQRVVEAHRMAVDRTLQVLESRYAQTRVTTDTGRRTVKTGNLIAAVFPHGTSREAEPQLHSHCVVMNATQLENGSWYSFSNDSAIMNKKLLGQVYQNELAVELKKIGYEVEQRAHGQFDIKGYSPELLKTFSTRRGQIEALMAEWQASGKTVRDAEGNRIQSDLLLREVANLQSRKAKPQIIEAGQLLQSWRAVLAMQGLSLPELPDDRAVAKEGSAIATTSVSNQAIASASSQVVRDAISHCGERDAIFRATAIEKFAFEHHIGELSVTELESAITNHSELITVDEEKGKVTTQTALQLELTTIRLMQQGKGQVSAIASDDEIAHRFEGSSLSEEQRRAIATSCQSLDQVIGWQGAAGAGKTYALNALKEIAEAEGYEVSGYAPSAAAAHELGESLNIDTNTVARLLLESAAAAENADRRRRRKLWLIDEAGLLSMRDARALLTKASESNVRVVLVGDTRQLSAVEAGNPFRSLQAGGMVTAHLDQARRQQQAELRQAVQMISQGEVGAGIQVLERSGAISEIGDAQARGVQLVSDYLSLSADERRETLLLSGTNANRLALTRQIRAGMQAEGSLKESVYTMPSLQRKDLTLVQSRYVSHYDVGDVIVPVRDYRQQGLEKHQQYRVSSVDAASNLLTLETSDHQLIQIDPALCKRKAVYTTLDVEIAAGDRLKWTKNNRVAGTRNGQPFTVESITPKGLAQIVTDQNEVRTIDLSTGAQHIDYAWVSTTYSSQGKTAGAVMALIDNTTNKEAFYVATSRARQRLQLYTSSVEDLQKLAEQSRANENVSDYIPLFELTDYEHPDYEHPLSQPATEPTADHRRGVADDVGRSLEHRQQAAVRRHQPEQSAALGDGSSPSRVVEQYAGLIDSIEEHLEQEERTEQAAGLGEAASAVDRSAQHVEQQASAAAQLNEQLERTAQSRKRLGSRWPQRRDRKLADTPKPKLKQETRYLPLFELPTASSPDFDQAVAQQVGAQIAQNSEPQTVTVRSSLERLQVSADSPPSESAELFSNLLDAFSAYLKHEELKEQAAHLDEISPVLHRSTQHIEQSTQAVIQLSDQIADKATALVARTTAPAALLTQQLNDFAKVLGYQPGDLMYVRALLPKHLSDELALKHGLKFEIEEKGQKRLIPNTRRGYLTVGDWSFTHLRKDKEPVVYADGLAALTELNQQGRGIYFVVNPGGERDAEITAARSVFWENDNKTKAQQLEQVRTSGLPVGAIVETHQSLHCYTPLASPLHDLTEWGQLQERAIQQMDSDPAIRNRSRLMRLPGFDHVRVEGEAISFSPVTLRYIEPQAAVTVEALKVQLPLWDADRWQQASQTHSKTQGSDRPRFDSAVTPSLAADNPWDIRNFAQYLNGDQRSQNGWLQVQCPEHGGDGHSGNSLHINEQTGQYKCHGGCDSQAVYTAAWELAQSRGWEPPKKRKKSISLKLQTDKPAVEIKPVEEPARKLTRWERYSDGLTTPPGRKRDFQIARKAISDGLSKKQVITLLAKNSPSARKLYRNEGSTPAYHYVEMVAQAAQKASQQQPLRQHIEGTEL